MPNLRFSLPLGVATGCIAALALPTSVPAAAPPPHQQQVSAAAPARDPGALQAMLARYDRMKPGAEREALALAIDQHAGQRYATVSRLYWYTELDAAEAAARASHRPILALRMLGRLDEDLSCANSRMFRTTLYANTAVSKFLRENFVLYWSSERAVPKVTIDFGDGRTIQGTTTGNSAHYVLDERGEVLDVLPGLYAPTAFTAELTKSLALANQVARLELPQRHLAISRYHQAAGAKLREDWTAVAGTPYLPGRHKLTTQTDVDSVLALAQRATFAKGYIEVPQLRAIAAGTDPGVISDGELALWAAAGQKTWNIGGPVSIGDQAVAALTAGLDIRSFGFVAVVPPPQPKQAKRAEPAKSLAPVLDDRSRALIAKLHTSGGMTATPEQIQAVIDRLEQHIVADSALNQYKLRGHIHERMRLNAGQPLAELNAWIYATVFHTPESDEWLGLLPRVDFTGLPGDGASKP